MSAGHDLAGTISASDLASRISMQAGAQQGGPQGHTNGVSEVRAIPSRLAIDTHGSILDTCSREWLQCVAAVLCHCPLGLAYPLWCLQEQEWQRQHPNPSSTV
jgi:hypothetical protein